MAARMTKVMIDHDSIQRWAEERGAKPAVVKGTTIIRLDFPGYAGPPELQPLSWDEWFRLFDEQNLALVYQEKTARGRLSNFNKLISRESVDLRTGRLIAPPRRRRKQAARAAIAMPGARKAAQPGRRRAAAAPKRRAAAKAPKRGAAAGAKRRTTARTAARTGRAGAATQARKRSTGPSRTQKRPSRSSARKRR